MNSPLSFLMLVWIEIKRCHGWIFAIVCSLIGIALVRGDVSGKVVVWNEAIFSVVGLLTAIGCLGAGYAAWQAGRLRRSRTSAQVTCGAVRAGISELALLAAIVFWMVTTYAIVVGFVVIGAARAATWGGPDLGLLLVGATIVVCEVAIGFLAGALIGSSLVAPFTTLILVALNATGGSESGPLRLLPFSFLLEQNRGVQWETQSGESMKFVLWMVGVTGVCSVGLLIVRRRSTVVVIAASIACLVAGTGAANLAAAAPSPKINRQLDCQVVGAVEVCLHPAYSAMTEEIGLAANRVLEPILGLPHVPIVFEQTPDGSTTLPDSASLSIGDQEPYDAQLLRTVLFQIFIMKPSGPTPMTDAELAVVQWIIDDSGVPMMNPWIDDFENPRPVAEIMSKAKHLSALSADERQQWITTNWNALLSGNLTLEDLL